MTTIHLKITVKEQVSPEALGKWLEGWIRDAWDVNGGSRMPGPGSAIHLESVEAKPPASGKSKAQAKRDPT